MSTFTPAHSPFEEESPAFADVREAAALAASGQRLDRTAAEALYYKASLHTLAQLQKRLPSCRRIAPQRLRLSQHRLRLLRGRT